MAFGFDPSFSKLQDNVTVNRKQEMMANHFGYDGISRPNRYEVTLFPPTSSNRVNQFTAVMGEMMGDGTIRSAGHRCESISMPGRSLNTSEDGNIYGPIRKIVNGQSFADVSATFQCDANLKEKSYFETWQRLAYNPQTFAVGYYHDYIGFVDIYTLDQQDNKRYGVRLMEAYPISINEQALAYATNDTYQTLTVNFAYRYWKNLTDEATLPRPLGERLAERSAATAVRRARANKLGLYGTSYGGSKGIQSP